MEEDDENEESEDEDDEEEDGGDGWRADAAAGMGTDEGEETRKGKAEGEGESERLIDQIVKVASSSSESICWRQLCALKLSADVVGRRVECLRRLLVQLVETFDSAIERYSSCSSQAAKVAALCRALAAQRGEEVARGGGGGGARGKRQGGAEHQSDSSSSSSSMGSSSNTSNVGGGGGGGGRLASPEEVREEEARDGEVVHLERDARELTRHIATTHRLYRKARSHLPPIMRYHSDTGRLHRNCFGMALGPRACVAADPSVRATLWRQSQLLRSLALTYFTKWETLVAAHTRARTTTRDLGLALHLTMKAQQDRWLPPPPPDARGERGERGERGDVPYATDAT